MLGIRTALPDPVFAATYACQYLTVAKAASQKGSGNTRIIAYTKRCRKRGS